MYLVPKMCSKQLQMTLKQLPKLGFGLSSDAPGWPLIIVTWWRVDENCWITRDGKSQGNLRKSDLREI
jgi:hypothetical protein